VESIVSMIYSIGTHGLSGKLTNYKKKYHRKYNLLLSNTI
jgi:hypothetical protein